MNSATVRVTAGRICYTAGTMNVTDTTIIEFENVSFFYPDEESEDPENPTRVFTDLSIQIPAGMTALVGENGIGKSTFLLLAGARLMPMDGTVRLLGQDTRDFADAPMDPQLEETRNQLVSFIYQNMEFETDDAIGDLMEAVYEHGALGPRDGSFLSELVDVLELKDARAKRMQELSKGQLQRAIIAFSLLYGSPVVMMDEPVFALEEPQKERVFEYLLAYCRTNGTSILYSAHNLELSKKYSDSTLLFRKNNHPVVGPTPDVFTRDNIEKAFQAPMDTLYRRDTLYRQMLNQSARRDS
ncbi:MAG: ATP-binding cassette domain-containing protein [Spirochaetaceae bacterium]